MRLGKDLAQLVLWGAWLRDHVVLPGDEGRRRDHDALQPPPVKPKFDPPVVQQVELQVPTEGQGGGVRSAVGALMRDVWGGRERAGRPGRDALTWETGREIVDALTVCERRGAGREAGGQVRGGG